MKALLKSDPDLQVVGEAANGKEEIAHKLLFLFTLTTSQRTKTITRYM